jgi:hypothetical protein
MIIFIVFFVLTISLRQSPSVIILGIIGMSLTVRLLFFLKKLFFLFFIWNLVYIGGIIIVFTYVVFFSNYNGGGDPRIFFILFWGGGGFLFTKKIIWQSSPTPWVELNQPEIFINFLFLGEGGWPLLIFLFTGITLVLSLLLPILKSTTNQFLLSLS